MIDSGIKDYVKYIKKIHSHKLYVSRRNEVIVSDLKSVLVDLLKDSTSEESFYNFINSSKCLLKYSSNPSLVPVIIGDLYSSLKYAISKSQFLNYVSLTFDTRKDVLDNNFKIIVSNEHNEFIVSKLIPSSIERILAKEATFEDILKFNEVAKKRLIIGFRTSSLTATYSEVVTYLNKFHAPFDSECSSVSKGVRNRSSDFINFFDK